MVAIHRRVAKDECFVVLRGTVGVITHGDDGASIGGVVLCWESGCYGGGCFWGCMVGALVLGCVVFGCKDGGVCGA